MFKASQASVTPFRTVLIIALLALIVVVLSVRDAAGPSKKPHSFTIVSDESLQIVQPSEREWWEQGIWPLMGAVAVVVVSNGVTILVVYLQASKAFGSLLRQHEIERLSSSLNDFYSPLLALIDVNEAIYSKTGPPSFPEDEIPRNAAGLVWKQMRKTILANNGQIESIVKTKAHLMSNSDSLEAYNALMLHVAIYKAQQRVLTDLYGQFTFPKDVRQHIFDERAAVRSTFERLCRIMS